ncbi:MAG: VCBS repeat-containing protein [Gemmataceae bacterium]
MRLSLESLEARDTPSVSVVSFVNAQNITEYRLLNDGFHFASVVYPPDQVVGFRPHPDLTDINGFGTTFQMAPFLGGGDAISDPPTVTANNPANTITIALRGTVNRTVLPQTNYGTWTETITVSFNPVTQTITGTGTLGITLTGTLTAAAADLNLGRIKSNFLNNVPLLPNGTGDTGDMKQIDVAYSTTPGAPNFTWIPIDGNTFPNTVSPTLTLNTVGDVNRVDTASMGLAAIKVARKPTLSVSYEAVAATHGLSAGLVYDTLAAQDPFADNVGAVPLLLRTTTTDTALAYTLSLTSAPIDLRKPTEAVIIGGPAEGVAVVHNRAFADSTYPTQPTDTVSPFGAINAPIRSATGDINGDTIPDLVLVTGPGTPIRVAVLSGADNRTLLVQPFDPFGGDFTGGGFVATGDVNGDGRDEFVVTPDQGGGPRVSIYSLLTNNTVFRRLNFFGIDDPSFRGGARAALGDVNKDGTPDLAVCAGFLGGPRTSLYNGTSLFFSPTRLVADFYAFPGRDAQTLRNGVFVSAGDIDGDGYSELIFGGGPGGAPRVFILSGATITQSGVGEAQRVPLANFFVAGNSTNRGGVRVAAKDLDGDARADLAVGSGDASPGFARLYRATSFVNTSEPAPLQDLSPFGGGIIADGIFVG